MLQSNNIDEIDTILFNHSPVNRRRIKKECELLSKKCSNIIIDFHNKESIVKIEKDGNEFIFIVSSNYPFNKPKLILNGKSIESFFNLKTNRFKTILKYISGIDCFCCNTYLCTDNWNPKITMENVINQIEEYKTLKYYIFLKIIIDKIKEKYLQRDIDLDSWLFNVSPYYPWINFH